VEIKNSNWFGPVFILIWSTGFIIAKYGMPYCEPLTFLAIRFAGVIILVIPILLWFKPPWPTFSQSIHIAIAGALLQCVYLGGVWISIREGMPAGLSSLIVGLQPILTAILASTLSERVTRSQWGGLLLGLLGVFLVVYAKIDTKGVSPMNLVFNAVALSGNYSWNDLSEEILSRNLTYVLDLLFNLLPVVFYVSLGLIF
jgi:drug/metabolite transporter (DMT)-like permease